MTLQDIKQIIGIATLNFNNATTEKGDLTEWYRHWENASRQAVSIHKDTLLKLVEAKKTGKEQEMNLGLQTEERTAEQGMYTAYRIVLYKEAEFTL